MDEPCKSRAVEEVEVDWWSRLGKVKERAPSVSRRKLRKLQQQQQRHSRG